jgi:hypothetical protein
MNSKRYLRLIATFGLQNYRTPPEKPGRNLEGIDLDQFLFS